MSTPEKILADNGQIFYGIINGTPVATCALIALGEGVFELAKMAVSKDYQGRGIGSKLYDFAEKWALENGATKVILSSNTSLTAAMQLYEKKGFLKQPKIKESKYLRCNIQFAKLLEFQSLNKENLPDFHTAR